MVEVELDLMAPKVAVLRGNLASAALLVMLSFLLLFVFVFVILWLSGEQLGSSWRVK